MKLGPEDFRVIGRSKRSDAYFLARFFLWLGVSVVGLVLYEAVYHLTGEPIIGVGAFIIYICALKTFFKRQEDSRFERLSEESREYDLIVNRAGIIQKIGRTETKYTWKELESIERLAEFLELNMWDGAVFYVPKRVFEAESDYDACYAFSIEQQKSIAIGHA